MISIMELQTALIAIWVQALKPGIIVPQINFALQQQKTMNSCKKCSQ